MAIRSRWYWLERQFCHWLIGTLFSQLDRKTSTEPRDVVLATVPGLVTQFFLFLLLRCVLEKVLGNIWRSLHGCGSNSELGNAKVTDDRKESVILNERKNSNLPTGVGKKSYKVAVR